MYRICSRIGVPTVRGINVLYDRGGLWYGVGLNAENGSGNVQDNSSEEIPKSHTGQRWLYEKKWSARRCSCFFQLHSIFAVEQFAFLDIVLFLSKSTWWLNSMFVTALCSELHLSTLFAHPCTVACPIPWTCLNESSQNRLILVPYWRQQIPTFELFSPCSPFRMQSNMVCPKKSIDLLQWISFSQWI